MTAMTDSPEAPQHLVDFARLWVAVRRGRRLWLTFAMLGMVIGGALTVLMPPPASAVTRILVIHEEDSPADNGSLIRTDVAVMMTTRIAAAALDKLGSRERPEDFLKEFEVLGVTNNMLEVTVKGPTGAEAVRRAKALADAFIADHVGRIQAAGAAEAKAFTDQRTQLQAELDQVNAQISGAETAQRESEDDEEVSPPGAATLDSLYARRADLTSQISQLTQQAEQAGFGQPRVIAGTQIVDAPRPVKVSLKATLATTGGIGLGVGLVVGVALAAVSGVVRDKPVLRRDIAEHLGASIIAELPRRRRRILPGKKAAQTFQRVTATLVRLVRDGSGPVSILELGAAPLASDLAVGVATQLADEHTVVLVADPPGRIKETPDNVRLIGADDTSPPQAGETRIGLGSVGPGTAWTDLPHLGTETLLIVKAGHANAAWLHTVARQLADAGIPIIGVVLADPDRGDKSDGTLWDGLYTALRGRAKHKANTNGTANGKNTHDLPTKRFAPVRPAEKKG